MMPPMLLLLLSLILLLFFHCYEDVAAFAFAVASVNVINDTVDVAVVDVVTAAPAVFYASVDFDVVVLVAAALLVVAVVFCL